MQIFSEFNLTVINRHDIFPLLAYKIKYYSAQQSAKIRDSQEKCRTNRTGRTYFANPLILHSFF